MITKKKATEMMMEFDSLLFSSQKDVDLAITMAASTGNQSVTFFYQAKAATKLKTLLRKKGFYVETATFKSSVDQELITVVWDTEMLTSHERNTELK
jgi:hypothetical protein